MIGSLWFWVTIVIVVDLVVTLIVLRLLWRSRTQRTLEHLKSEHDETSPMGATVHAITGAGAVTGASATTGTSATGGPSTASQDPSSAPAGARRRGRLPCGGCAGTGYRQLGGQTWVTPDGPVKCDRCRGRGWVRA